MNNPINSIKAGLSRGWAATKRAKDFVMSDSVIAATKGLGAQAVASAKVLGPDIVKQGLFPPLSKPAFWTNVAIGNGLQFGGGYLGYQRAKRNGNSKLFGAIEGVGAGLGLHVGGMLGYGAMRSYKSGILGSEMSAMRGAMGKFRKRM